MLIHRKAFFKASKTMVMHQSIVRLNDKGLNQNLLHYIKDSEMATFKQLWFY